MCPSFPIPGDMVTTGTGPGQIPRRDPATGDIPGAPTIFTRTLVDEIAQLTRRQIPSGFLNGGNVYGLPQKPLIVSVAADAEVIIDGYRLALGTILTPDFELQLTLPPTLGTRDDLVFIEFWFDYHSAQSRTLKWRLRTVPGVDFTTYPDGLSDPKVTAFDNVGLDTLTPFAHTPLQFYDRRRDVGMYLAARSGQTHDILSEPDINGVPHKLTYALPLARIKRLNTTAYDPLANPNGAPASTSGTISPRPDGLFNDVIDTVHQIVDMRQTVDFTRDVHQLFCEGLTAYLTGQLTAHGVAREAVVALGATNQQSYFGDPGSVGQFVVSTNLVYHSHFEVDTNSNGIADGWTAYQTGTVTGQRIYGNPGQVLERTADDANDVYGIQQTLSGFSSSQYRLQVGYITAWTNAGCTLVIEGARPDNSLAFQERIDVTAVPTGIYQEVVAVFNNMLVDRALTLRAYLVSSGGQLTLTHVDLRADLRQFDLMAVTDGTIYSIKRDPALVFLGATLDMTHTHVFDSQTGSTLTATVMQPDADTLKIQLAANTNTRDLKIVVPVIYPGGSGFSDLLTIPDKAWDVTGFAGLIYTADTQANLTAAELGQLVTVGEQLTAYNPTISHKGLTVTLVIAGNGTGTYTLPAFKYGKVTLLPLNVTIAGSPQILSALQRYPDGTLTFTLGNNATVSSSNTFTMELALAAPLVVWDNQANGVTGVYRTMLISAAAPGGTTIISVAAPGLVQGPLDSNACLAVFVDGLGVTLTQGATLTGSGTPVLTVQLPFAPAAGAKIEVAVVLHEAVRTGSGLSIAYETTPMADNTDLIATPVYRFVTNPVMLAHTKGTAAVDYNSDFGPGPFVRDPNLDSRTIGLLGQTSLRSTIQNIPLLANSLFGRPLTAGREIGGALGTFAGVVEGQPLNTAAPHRVVLAALISLHGRLCLWVAESSRTDARNLVDASATVRILDLNQRPISLA